MQERSLLFLKKYSNSFSCISAFFLSLISLTKTRLPVIFPLSSFKYEIVDNTSTGLPDFVFVDVNMPFVNGLEFLDLIKKDDRLKELPVILYSTGIDNTIVCAAMNKGAFACIKKQNSIKDLVKKLKTLFAENSLHKAVNYASLAGLAVNLVFR